MTAPDFEVILAVAMTSTEFSGRTIYSPPRAASSALAAKVPELCSACDGSGMVRNRSRSGDTHVDCHDCPTIARLLAIGAAVMTATVEVANEAYIFAGGRCSSFANELLDALRAVEP